MSAYAYVQRLPVCICLSYVQRCQTRTTLTFRYPSLLQHACRLSANYILASYNTFPTNVEVINSPDFLGFRMMRRTRSASGRREGRCGLDVDLCGRVESRRGALQISPRTCWSRGVRHHPPLWMPFDSDFGWRCSILQFLQGSGRLSVSNQFRLSA